jgi:hypothetical protein
MHHAAHRSRDRRDVASTVSGIGTLAFRATIVAARHVQEELSHADTSLSSLRGDPARRPGARQLPASTHTGVVRRSTASSVRKPTGRRTWLPITNRRWPATSFQGVLPQLTKEAMHVAISMSNACNTALVVGGPDGRSARSAPAALHRARKRARGCLHEHAPSAPRWLPARGRVWLERSNRSFPYGRRRRHTRRRRWLPRTCWRG